MTQHILTVTAPAFRQLVNGLTTDGNRRAECPAGISRGPERLEWLLHTVRWRSTFPNPPTARVLVCGAASAEQLPHRLDAVRGSADGLTVELALGVGGAAGHVTGVCRTSAGMQALDRVAIIGAGLPRIVLAAALPIRLLPSPIDEAAAHIWSRTIGALGEPAWQRLRSLHIGVIGCGRSGSLAATALHQLGIAGLTLIDSDTLEAHNLGEMAAVSLADLNRPKVHAVADALANRELHTATVTQAVPESILSLAALVAVKQADVLFCCVDNAAARLAAGALATLYLKPLLDIGTGIVHQGSASPAVQRRRMGADIRLVLPGRCLLCLGGIAQFERGLAELLAGSAERASPGSERRDWRQERAGSLLSLNGVAVHLALRLLEDLVSGRIAESTWLHLEISDTGIPTIDHRQRGVVRECRLCSLTGHGNEGVSHLHSMLEEPRKTLPRPE